MLEKILVVDDDVNVRDRFFEILSSLGYKVTCVPMAKEAILRLAEERPDLVILDEKMPDVGGWEAAKEIRDFDKDLPIVMLSDQEPALEKLDMARTSNVQSVVQKDFSSHLMMRAILDLLKRQQDLKLGSGLPIGSKAIIMVVDDNADIRMVLWNFLTKKGFKVIQASGGEEAILNLKTQPERPRIVLLDFRMPGMDGITVIKKIKEIDDSIKVVMLTSASENYVIEEAKRNGASDFLIKPCDLGKLENVISALLITDKI